MKLKSKIKMKIKNINSQFVLTLIPNEAGGFFFVFAPKDGAITPQNKQKPESKSGRHDVADKQRQQQKQQLSRMNGKSLSLKFRWWQVVVLNLCSFFLALNSVSVNNEKAYWIN